MHRLNWAPPVIVQQPEKNAQMGKIEGDQRGVFADIGVTRIAFKNVMKQPLKIIINSPRARVSDTSNCYVRRYKRELEVQPGRTKWYSLNWGDKANIFTPMVSYLDNKDQTPSDKTQLFSVADFVIVIPDIDEMSGLSMDKIANQSAVDIRVEQRYIATGSYLAMEKTGNTSAVTFVYRKPIVVTKLPDIQSMMYENPIELKGFLPGVVGVRGVAGNNVVFGEHGPLLMPQLEGRMLVLHGVGGYFKVQNSNLVHWNVAADAPFDVLEPVFVANGCPYQVLPETLQVSFKDVIGWLTTITEILTIVASFA